MQSNSVDICNVIITMANHYHHHRIGLEPQSHCICHYCFRKLDDTGQNVAGITAYQVATCVLVGSCLLVEASDGKSRAAVRLTVLRQVAPRYWKIVDNPVTSNNDTQRSAVTSLTIAAVHWHCQTCIQSLELVHNMQCLDGWRGGTTGRALDLWSTGRGLKSYSEQKLRNNLGQVVHTYVPLSPSSITW